MGSVANTRHNMSQSTLVDNGNGGAAIMNPFRNRYGEVCVYCHTPHAANANVAAPLWNRALSVVTYTTYNQLGTSTLSGTVTQPGAASLPCLSCHDGLQATDAIINMPGFGGYYPNPDPTQWNLPGNPGGLRSSQHRNLVQCMACHNAVPGGIGDGVATDFTAFLIGTDLRDDHPIGVTFPAASGPGTDWKTPTGSRTVGPWTTRFYDENGNGRMDKEDIRLYDTGGGPKVECASCHDPHGVPGGGGTFNRTFLRKTNEQSGVCLTCHAK
jgi:hypothetical protein